MKEDSEMALLDELNLYTFVQGRVRSGGTHKSVAAELRNLFPGVFEVAALINL